MNEQTAFFFGSFSVYKYGIVIAFALLAGLMTAFFTMKMQRRDYAGDMLLACVAAMPAALILGRAFYCLFLWGDVKKGVFSPFDLLSGGYAFYGILAGVFMSVFIISRVRGIRFCELSDAISPALCLTIAIGRFASLFSDFDRGPLVENPAFARLPFAVLDNSSDGWHLAVFMLEAIAALFIFIVLLIVHRRVYKSADIPVGSVTFSFMLLFGLAQSMLESLRSDSLFMPLLAFVRVSQILSAIMALAAFTAFFIRSMKSGGRKFGVVCYIFGLALFGIAFYMEKSLGDNNTAVNYSIMGCCLLAIALLGLILLGRRNIDAIS